MWRIVVRTVVALLACTVAGCGPPAGKVLELSPARYAAQVINPQFNRAMISPRDQALLVWGTDGSILRSRDGTRWDQALVPTDSDLADIAADDAGLLVAVGKQGVILRSEDSARQWSKVTENHAIDLKSAVYHAPSRAWLAAGSNGTVLRSTDQANTWHSVSSAVSSTFEKLFVDPRGQSLLLGGEQGVIGRSDDGGSTWIFTAVPMPAPVTPITGFYRYDDLLLATSALGRLMLSRDDGAHWSLLQTESNGYFTAAVFDAEHDAIVLTTHNGQVVRSADRGKSWQRHFAADGYLSAISYDARAKSLLLAGHHGLLARSGDGGRSWQAIPSGSSADLNVLLRAGLGNAWIAAGEGGCILRSDTAGTNWQTIAPALQLNLREVLLLPRENVLVASGELGGVLRSLDGGTRWQFIDVQYPDKNTPPNLRALVVEPHGALLAAGPPGTIIRSNTAGQRWDITHWTPLQAQEAFAWLAVDASSQSVLAIEAHSIHRSVDGGSTWTRTAIDTDRELWHAAQLPGSDVVVVAGQRGVALRSEGSGAWQSVDTGTQADLYGSYADQASGAFFLLGQQGTLLRSTDAGKSWRAMFPASAHALRRMVRLPQGNVLIGFGEHGSIVRSEDAGENWQVIASGTDAELRKALTAPDGGVFLVGQQGVILQSQDAGQSWARMATHTRRNFRSAVLDPRSGELIAVGERIVRLTPQLAGSGDRGSP